MPETQKCRRTRHVLSYVVCMDVPVIPFTLGSNALAMQTRFANRFNCLIGPQIELYVFLLISRKFAIISSMSDPEYKPAPQSIPNQIGAEIPYDGCPLCAGKESQLVQEANCGQHPLWQPGLPTQLRWLCCNACSHVFRSSYFSPAAMKLLFSRAHACQVVGTEIDQQRAQWADTVHRVNRLMPEPVWNGRAAVWVDIGCGNGGLVFTSAEFGFQAIGIDMRQAAVEQITALGFNAFVGDIAEMMVTDPVDVISMADVLEHVPYPREALKRVFGSLKPEGVIVVSCPNYDCASWRATSKAGTNPYWGEIEHFHNFSRASLMRLLAQEGFMPVDYQVSRRYKSCMEITAVRTDSCE